MDNNDLNEEKPINECSTEENLLQTCNDEENIMDLYENDQSKLIEDTNAKSNDKPADLYSKILNSNFLDFSKLTPMAPINSFEAKITGSENNSLEKETKLETSDSVKKGNKSKNVKPYAWEELFSDLDPLGNLEAFDLKLSAASKNFQHT